MTHDGGDIRRFNNRTPGGVWGKPRVDNVACAIWKSRTPISTQLNSFVRDNKTVPFSKKRRFSVNVREISHIDERN